MKEGWSADAGASEDGLRKLMKHLILVGTVLVT